MEVQKTIKGVVHKVDLLTTPLKKIENWLLDSCDTETPLSSRAVEVLEKRVAIKGLHWEKHAYLLYWALTLLVYVSMLAATYFSLTPAETQKFQTPEVLGLMAVYLGVSLIVGGVLYVIIYPTFELNGAARIRNKLQPLSAQEDAYFLGSSYCDEALKYVTEHKFCQAYRDKVVRDERELRYFDLCVLRSMVSQHRIQNNAMKHRQACQALHGVV